MNTATAALVFETEHRSTYPGRPKRTADPVEIARSIVAALGPVEEGRNVQPARLEDAARRGLAGVGVDHPSPSLLEETAEALREECALREYEIEAFGEDLSPDWALCLNCAEGRFSR